MNKEYMKNIILNSVNIPKSTKIKASILTFIQFNLIFIPTFLLFYSLYEQLIYIKWVSIALFIIIIICYYVYMNLVYVIYYYIVNKVFLDNDDIKFWKMFISGATHFFYCYLK